MFASPSLPLAQGQGLGQSRTNPLAVRLRGQALIKMAFTMNEVTNRGSESLEELLGFLGSEAFPTFAQRLQKE